MEVEEGVSEPMTIRSQNKWRMIELLVFGFMRVKKNAEIVKEYYGQKRNNKTERLRPLVGDGALSVWNVSHCRISYGTNEVGHSQ